MARVYLTDDAKEDLRDLDGSARKIVLKALVKLEEEPEQRGQPLGSRADGNLTTFRKLVIGDRDYRAVYRVEEDGTVVVVWVIKERADGECYELAVNRLRLHGDRQMAELAQSLLVSAWRYKRPDKSDEVVEQ
ncbi:type II toxin-antitoxin system mRNA interferase toxin, RelE/StbE family [Amycolatopsis sp. NPDC048633]|uniref:type II toxin-antitoxin system RelE family toxin n=1 Tax=Amycolatopsis sp. NPDC048633 TaxID=3157095 RepID=UPI0033D4BB44